MKYSDLETLLKTVLPDAVYHLSAPSEADRYIIWTETGSRSLHANDRACERILQASVYIYTQTENDTLLDDVRTALEASDDIAVGDPVPAFDDELLTMGWVLECEVI